MIMIDNDSTILSHNVLVDPMANWAEWLLVKNVVVYRRVIAICFRPATVGRGSNAGATVEKE